MSKVELFEIVDRKPTTYFGRKLAPQAIAYQERVFATLSVLDVHKTAVIPVPADVAISGKDGTKIAGWVHLYAKIQNKKILDESLRAKNGMAFICHTKKNGEKKVITIEVERIN